MDESRIIIVDDNNVEHEMNILFTYFDEKSGKNFVTYFDPNDQEGNIYASIYDEENHLFPITDENDWKVVEEVLENYMSENQYITDHECGCGCEDDSEECNCEDCECEEEEEEEEEECGCEDCHCEEEKK